MFKSPDKADAYTTCETVNPSPDPKSTDAPPRSLIRMAWGFPVEAQAG